MKTMTTTTFGTLAMKQTKQNKFITRSTNKNENTEIMNTGNENNENIVD